LQWTKLAGCRTSVWKPPDTSQSAALCIATPSFQLVCFTFAVVPSTGVTEEDHSPNRELFAEPWGVASDQELYRFLGRALD